VIPKKKEITLAHCASALRESSIQATHEKHSKIKMPRRPAGRHDDDDHRDDFDDDPDDGYDYKNQPKLRKKQAAGDEEVIEKVVIAPEFHRFIVRERQRIENECVLDIPPKDKRDSAIYIMGARRNVVACAAQITAIVARETAKAAVTQETAKFVALEGQEQVSIAIDFERTAMGLFVGKNGARLADLRARLRGQGGREFIAEVLLPDQSDTTSIVTVKIQGLAAADRAVSIIRAFSEFYELGAFLKSVTVVNSNAAAVMNVDASDRGRRSKPTGNKPASPAAAPAAAEKAPAAAAAAAAAPVASAADSAAAPASAAFSATTQQRHKRIFPAFKEMSPDKFPHAVLECRFDA
jgi:hypothetical protein